MTEQISGAISCAACGASCEGKPHAKDAKGRVICRACIDRKRAEKAASGGADVMAELLGTSRMANSAPCPSCKSYMPQDMVVCSACGYNTQTGKAAHTRVIAAPKEKKEKAGRGTSLSLDPMMGVWLAVLAFGALTAGVFMSPEIIFFLYVALFTYNTVLWIWVAISAFVDQAPGWGVVLLIPGLHLFTGSYYLSARAARPALRGHFFTGLIFAIVTALLATSFLEDAIQKVDPSAQVSGQSG